METIRLLLYPHPSNPDVMETCGDLGMEPHISSAIIIVGILATLQGFFHIIPNFFIGAYGCYLISMIAICVGIGMINDIHGIMIDRKKKVMIKWKSIFRKKSTYSIKSATEVILSVEKRIIGGGEFDDIVIMYRISIAAGQPLFYTETTIYEIARLWAKQLARFLDLPLLDLTRGSPPIRQTPDKFDLSIIDKMKKENSPLIIPPPPGDLKSATQRDTQGISFDIPPAGLTPRNVSTIRWTWLIAISAMGFAGIYRWGHDIPAPDITVFYTATGIVSVLLPLLISIRVLRLSRFRPYRVRVDRSGLAMTKQGFFKKKTVTIAPGKLKDLRIFRPSKYLKVTYDIDGRSQKNHRWGFDIRTQGSDRIVAISDLLTFEYGQGLATEELEYILALAKKELQALFGTPLLYGKNRVFKNSSKIESANKANASATKSRAAD